MKNRWLPKPGASYVRDLKELGLPEVPLVGIHNLTEATPGLSEHVHVRTMEICYLTRGERVYHVGGEDYRLRGNDVFVTFPDERHGSGRNPHGKGLLYWMNLRLPSRRRPFLCLSADEAWPLVQALKSLPARHFRGEREMRPLFEDIFRVQAEGAPALKRLYAATTLLRWLRLVVESAQAGAGGKISSDMQRVADEIRAHPERTVALEEMADSVHLSLSRFKAKFKQHLGIPPAEFRLRRRVERASELLRSGRHSVTAVAYALGFSSSQYFATVFKRFTNLRPGQVAKTV